MSTFIQRRRRRRHRHTSALDARGSAPEAMSIINDEKSEEKKIENKRNGNEMRKEWSLVQMECLECLELPQVHQMPLWFAHLFSLGVCVQETAKKKTLGISAPRFQNLNVGGQLIPWKLPIVLDELKLHSPGSRKSDMTVQAILKTLQSFNFYMGNSGWYEPRRN